MDIRQLSVRYHTDQDRILVCISTTSGEEVQMWLTRRMTAQLLPLINRVVIDHFAIPQDAKTDGYVDLAAIGPKARDMLADMRLHEAVAAGDFATPYQCGQSQWDIGHAPLVAASMVIGEMVDENDMSPDATRPTYLN